MTVTRIIEVHDIGEGYKGHSVRVLLTFPEGTTELAADEYIRLNERVRRQVLDSKYKEMLSAEESTRRSLSRLRGGRG